MMVPVGRLVVMRGTAKDEVIAAIAYLTWPALFAPVVAPVLGGVLTTYASWRWIFLVNVPLGVIGARPGLPARARPARAARRAGSTGSGWSTTTAGLGALVYGVSLLGRAPHPGAADASARSSASAGCSAVAVCAICGVRPRRSSTCGR